MFSPHCTKVAGTYNVHVLTLFGSTPLATKWYLCMALAHWQMEVQARDTLEMAAGVKSSLSMYGCILVMTASGMLSCD